MVTLSNGRFRLGATLSVVLVAGVGMVSGVPSATASPVPESSRVSHADPFARCSSSSDGITYRGAEIGASLAVDPRQPADMVAVYEQDPVSTRGALGAVAARSTDGGRTWSQTPLPFTGCAPGGADYPRTHEPVVSVGPDGTDYALSLSYDDGSSRSAVLVVSSTDGGRRWSPVTTIASYPAGSEHSIYKTASITADPARPGTAYAVWEDFRADGPHFYIPAMFSRTRDGGRTWTTPIAIAAKSRDQQADTNQIVVDPAHHRIYDFYPYFYCVCYSLPKVAFVVSTDGGRTWSGQHVINSLLGSGAITAPGGAPVRPGYGPVETIDPNSGKLYVSWLDNRYTDEAFDQVVVVSSADLGATWTRPTVVHAPGMPASYSPAMAVSRGTLGLTFQTYSRGRSAAEPDSQYWFTSSRDGVHFATPMPMSRTFGLGHAPTEESHIPGAFLGDYQALASTPDGFRAAFAITTCREGCPGNPTDIVSVAEAR